MKLVFKNIKKFSKHLKFCYKTISLKISLLLILPISYLKDTLALPQRVKASSDEG